MNSSSEQEHFDACRQWQEFFDNHLRDIGAAARPVTPGQHALDYVRESCRSYKRSFLPPVHELYKVNWRGLRNDALQALVPQLMEACVQEANNPSTVDPGEFRQINKRDEYGVLKEINFVGPQSFVVGMGRPCRRVTSWMTDKGFLHPNGHPMPVAQVRLAATAA